MTVYFIGAGPGDPELITVKGQRLIRSVQHCEGDRYGRIGVRVFRHRIGSDPHLGGVGADGVQRRRSRERELKGE